MRKGVKWGKSKYYFLQISKNREKERNKKYVQSNE
jgi:hypothetical protein